MSEIAEEVKELPKWARDRVGFILKRESDAIAWYLETYQTATEGSQKHAAVWMLTTNKIIKIDIELKEIKAQSFYRLNVKSIIRSYQLRDEDFDSENDISEIQVMLSFLDGSEIVLNAPTATRCDAVRKYRNFINLL
jgi:hypothetical protein